MAKKKLEVPDIDWNSVTPQLIEAIAPIIQGVAWIGLSNIDPKIEQLNTVIALGEVMPNVDIGLPPGVVLGAMYDKQDEALAMITQIMTLAKDVPAQIAEEADKFKELLIGEKLQKACEGVGGTWANGTCTIPKDKQTTDWPPDYLDQPTKQERLNSAIEACVKKAKEDLGIWVYTLVPLSAYVYSCLLQKGFDVTLDMVKKHTIITGALI